MRAMRAATKRGRFTLARSSQPQMRLKFLCVVAHPHDFTHCAGTMGIHHANGDECVVSSSSPSRHQHKAGGPAAG